MRSHFRNVAITAVLALTIGACDGGSSPPPAPTVTLTSSATDVGVPGPPVTLTWSSTHATSCTASGAWNHPVGTDGSEGVVVPQTSTYTISCSGRGGVATASVTIHAWDPPSASLTADLISVLPNTAVLLTWSSQNATECSGFLGPPGTTPTLPASGSQMSAPLTETTLFQIICGNPVFRAGIAEVVVEVTVSKFTVTELPIQNATALNDAGDVAGYRGSAGGGSTGDVVVWIAGAIVEVRVCQDPLYCYRSYTPRAINVARTVIGWGHYSISPMHPFSFVWHFGDYPDERGDTSEFLVLNDINDVGQIVGYEGILGRAVLITAGTVIRLSDFRSSADAINAASHIAGSVYTAADGESHLFLYVDGAMQDLGTMSGGDCYATGINASDAIVGWEDRLGGTRAFLYANSRFTDLGSLGSAASRANAINDAGQIVGTAGPVYGPSRAFLYNNGTMHDLNDLVAPLSVPLSEAWKINNRGQIIANGCPPAGTPGSCRAYLLTPISPP
jgi:probable HAF family extracellular repeat protein